MSLRLTWDSVLAIACCAAVVGCAPFKPWAGSKANPTGKGSMRASAPAQENLEHLLDDAPAKTPAPAAAPKPTKTRTAAKPTAKTGSSIFGGDSAKKQAARQVDIDSELALARLGERRGQADNAKQLYQKITEKYPEHPGAFHRLGVLHAQDGNYEEAYYHFEQAISITEPSVELLCDIGYCYYLQSRYEDAEKMLRQAFRMKPNHEATCNNLGLVLGAQARYPEALEMFQRVNSEAEAYANLAYVFSLQGDLKNAKKGYLEALTADKNLRPAAKALVQVDERLKLNERRASIANQRGDETPAPPTSTNPKQASRAHDDAGFVRSVPPARRAAPVEAETEPTPVVARRSAPVEVIELPVPREEEVGVEQPDQVAEAVELETTEDVVEPEAIEMEAPAPRRAIAQQQVLEMRPQPTPRVERALPPETPRVAQEEASQPARNVVQRPAVAMPNPATSRRPSELATVTPFKQAPAAVEESDLAPSMAAPVKPTIVPPLAVEPEAPVAKKETINNPFVAAKPEALATPRVNQLPAPATALPTPVAAAPVKPSRASSFVPPTNAMPAAEPAKKVEQPIAIAPRSTQTPAQTVTSAPLTTPSPTVAMPAVAPRREPLNSAWKAPSQPEISKPAPAEVVHNPNTVLLPPPRELTRVEPQTPATSTMKFGATSTPTPSLARTEPKFATATETESSAKLPVSEPSRSPQIPPKVAVAPAVEERPQLPTDISMPKQQTAPKSAMVINPTFAPQQEIKPVAKQPAKLDVVEQPSQLAMLGSAINTGVKQVVTPKPARQSAAAVAERIPAVPRQELPEPKLAPVINAPAQIAVSEPIARQPQVVTEKPEIRIAELPPIISARDFGGSAPQVAKPSSPPTGNSTAQLANAHSRTGLGNWVTTSAASRNTEGDQDLPPVITPSQASPQRILR